MRKSRISKDKAYLDMALVLAQRSTCIDKQVGCVIINDRNEIIATGYNGSPRGKIHCIDLGYCVKEKFCDANRCPSAHAEQNALINAARSGVSVINSALYLFGEKIYEKEIRLIDTLPCLLDSCLRAFLRSNNQRKGTKALCQSVCLKHRQSIRSKERTTESRAPQV